MVNSTETPGYNIVESAGSKAGACFVAANRERIPNRGQVELRLRAGKIPINSTFQVSKVSKPLWSVGKLRDAGCKVEFNKDEVSEGLIEQIKVGAQLAVTSFVDGVAFNLMPILCGLISVTD